MIDKNRIKEMFQFKQKINNWYWSERYIRRSIDRRKPTYYIIRRAEMAGLFSIVNTTLGNIKYAVEKGYIPVVDMMNYPSAYLSNQKLKVENAWEYFFEQPAGIGVKEAYDGKKVILGSGVPTLERPDDNMDFYNNVNNQLLEWRGYVKKYLHIKSNILADIDREFNALVSPNDRVLGIEIRGTDYVAKRPPNHPIQPDLDDMIIKAREMMRIYQCNKVLVGTEDKEYCIRLKKEFGEAFLINKKEFIEYQGGITPLTRIQRDNDEYLQGVEYLTTIVMLSKCNCFLGARNSGSVGAILLSDGFEHQYIYDLGKYE